MGFNLIQLNDIYDGQATEIILSNPPGNIFSREMMTEMLGALKEIQSDPHKKLIVLSGQGKHFCFGASVEEHKADQVGEMLPYFHQTISEILQSDVPILAKVRGLCLGGGFELALACGFIFSEQKARFAVPEIQLGVFPPVACALLALKVGDGLANQIILTGEQFEADLLNKYGLINTIVEGQALDDVVSDFFQKSFATRSAKSLRLANRAARQPRVHFYQSHIQKLEKLYLDDLMSTHDAVEGIEAFLDKRQPQWKDM